ncbi:MAG: YveK family protein [Eubacterium sp.]
MDIDANVKKIVTLLLKKWKLIILLGLIGVLLAYFYTANFTTLTYSSSVEFLASASDSKQEFDDSTTAATASYAAQSASNTSKMNYAMKMLDTYIEIFKTNEFNQDVADKLNEKYSTNYQSSTIKNSITIEKIENTAMFKITVTTTDATLSYNIACQLEKSIPDIMEKSNSGLVTAEVKDKAIKATTSESLNYTKKCLIGFAVGAVLAAAYIILRDLLDVRIKSAEELVERYDIPVLGSIPEFEIKGTAASKAKNTKGDN